MKTLSVYHHSGKNQNTQPHQLIVKSHCDNKCINKKDKKCHNKDKKSSESYHNNISSVDNSDSSSSSSFSDSSTSINDFSSNCKLTSYTSSESNKICKRKTLIFSCSDKHLSGCIVKSLEDTCLYDIKHFLTLPGASLGYIQSDYKTWRKTFLEQIQLSLYVHNIEQIIVIDHMNCPCYKLFYKNLSCNSEKERILHKKNIKKFIKDVKCYFPKMKYTGYLLDCDGTLGKIPC